jgi:SAM-dependent methyltransferase
MLKEARHGLSECVKFKFCQIDAQELPFPQNSFDVVIANHMLYHVPDIDQTVKDIRRVLKPDGVFLAATNGRDHMREVYEIGNRLIPELDVKHRSKFSIDSFTLENGRSKIGGHFLKIEKDIFDDSLKVTNATLLRNYILSIVDLSNHSILPAQITQFEDFLNQLINKNGFIKINKSQGLFIARG